MIENLAELSDNFLMEKNHCVSLIIVDQVIMSLCVSLIIVD